MIRLTDIYLEKNVLTDVRMGMVVSAQFVPLDTSVFLKLVLLVSLAR